MTILEQYRKQTGKSANAVAREVGITSVYLRSLETGAQPVSARLLAPLAKALGRTEEEIALASPPPSVDLRLLSPGDRFRVISFVKQLLNVGRATAPEAA